MKSTDFLQLQIDNLVKENPSIKCRYEFDVHSGVHLIEVTPFSMYELNEKYLAFESEIIFSFIDTFPDENICFISDDSLIKISNPTYTKVGALFAIINWLPSFGQTFDQIEPIQKPISFHQADSLNFVFWDDSKNKNNYKDEPITFVSNSILRMAA